MRPDHLSQGHRLTRTKPDIQHDTNASGLSSSTTTSTNVAFPPLERPVQATSSKPQPNNGPWALVGVQNLKTTGRLSPRVDQRDASISGPESQEPFPKLVNGSFDQAHNQAGKVWTRLMEDKGENMSVNTSMVTRDETSEGVSRLKAAKKQRRKKWRPVVLEGV